MGNERKVADDICGSVWWRSCTLAILHSLDGFGTFKMCTHMLRLHDIFYFIFSRKWHITSRHVSICTFTKIWGVMKHEVAALRRHMLYVWEVNATKNVQHCLSCVTNNWLTSNSELLLNIIMRPSMLFKIKMYIRSNFHFLKTFLVIIVDKSDTLFEIVCGVGEFFVFSKYFF